MVKYCNRCVYRFPELNDLKNDGVEDGSNICAKSMVSVRNVIGEDSWGKTKSPQFCQSCGSVKHDEGDIIYTKCAEKNRNKTCRDFRPKLRWRIASIFLKNEGVRK